MKKYIIKILFVFILVLFGTLLVKKNNNIKNYLYSNIYNKYLSLAKIKNIYNTYIGSIIPIKEDEYVFSEKIKYKELSTYNNGVKLSLEDNYSIPIIKDGIVIYIGNKDGLNKTVIVEDKDGVDILYGNMSKVNVKMYDYVKENDYLGEADNNNLYLIFQKGDEYLDYKEYLSN